MFINFWYPMAASDELTDQPLKVRCMGLDFVLFRDSQVTVDVLLQTAQPRAAQEADNLLQTFPQNASELQKRFIKHSRKHSSYFSFQQLSATFAGWHEAHAPLRLSLSQASRLTAIKRVIYNKPKSTLVPVCDLLVAFSFVIRLFGVGFFRRSGRWL